MQNQRDPPTPLKSQPDSKRPKTPNIVTRNLSEEPDPSGHSIRGVELVPLQCFSGTQIPLNSEVLCRFIFLRTESPKRPAKDISHQVFSELEAICLKALAIPKPTKKSQNAEKIIHDLYENYRTYTKTKTKNRAPSATETSFVKNLGLMCEIVAIDAEEQIQRCEERSEFKKNIDLDFLKDQRTTRRQFISDKVDTHHQKRVEKHLEEKMNAELHLQQLDKRYEGEVEEDDTEFHQSRNLREDRRTSNSVATKPQADAILKDDKVLKAFDRTKMSSRNALMVAAPIMEACGVDISKQTFSRPTLERWRKNMRNRVASDIKTKFKPPKRSVVHFDGKMLGDNSGNFGDHLAVMISGNTDECRNGKLISAKIIKDSTGESQANEVVSVAEDWNVTESIVGMCFDTTASNTGMYAILWCNMKLFDN